MPGGGDGLRALEEQLRARAPERIRDLPREHLAELAAALAAARRQQAMELNAAGERALSHIPRLLRGPVRRVLR